MQPSTFVIASILLILALFYLAVFRPWQLRWGATDEEVKRPMPGDDIVSKPSFNATRAVTINAPAKNIYPWIVQMGVNRAGWYSYDLLDNLARRSAEVILPEHQNIQVGDLIPMSPDGNRGYGSRILETPNGCCGGIKQATLPGPGEFTPKEKLVLAL